MDTHIRWKIVNEKGEARTALVRVGHGTPPLNPGEHVAGQLGRCDCSGIANPGAPLSDAVREASENKSLARLFGVKVEG